MSDTTLHMREEYASALQEYIIAPGEEALQRAYEIGRDAIALRLGALDIAWIHQEVLPDVFAQCNTPDDDLLWSRASTFLLESLAAFEMTHRGFLETIATLSQRATALASANQQLEKEIAERQTAEESLRKRESQLAEAQEVAHVGSWEWDMATNIVTWTDELYRLFCVAQGGRPITYDYYLSRVYPEDREMVNARVHRSLDTLEPYACDHRIATPDGTIRWVHSIGRVVTGHEHRPIRMVGTVQDITDRKRAEQARRMSEELFRSLIENASDVITILNTDGTIKYQSPSVERILGYTDREMTGTNVFAYVHPDDLPDLKDVFRTGILTPQFTVSRVFRARHKDDGWRMLESVGKNLIDVPGIAGILVASRDITEKVLLQKQLDETSRRSEQEARSYAVKVQQAQEEERQRIARELHDDICQRLTALRLQVNLIEDDLHPPDAGRKQLGSIKQQIDGMITDVRRMSANLRPMALDIFGLVTSLRVLCEETEKSLGMRVTFHTDGKETPLLSTQMEIALYRIAQEALSNAAKHSGADRIALGFSHEGDSVTLSIHDNGMGFPPRNAQKPGRVHTGYGLGNMRERAELLGGKCNIETGSDKGTIVNITVPLRSQ